MYSEKIVRAVIFYVLSILFLCSCDKFTNRSIADIELIKHTKIHLPLDSMQIITPSVQELSVDSTLDLYFVCYYDSTVCSPCEINRMGIWSSIVSHVNSINVKMNYIFIFKPAKDMKQFIHDCFDNHRIEYTVCVDSLGVFEKCNPLVLKKQYQSFVINKGGKILFVGNPANNALIEQSFYKCLQDKEYLDLSK